ncbi:MAG: BMP family ABC transporter substrate-binding protein [Draconibacterium sp.]
MKQMIFFTILNVFLFSSCSKNKESLTFEPSYSLYVLLPTQGFGDRSFVDDIYEGVEAAALNVNFEVDYIVPETLEEAGQWLSNFIGSTQKPSLIIVAGNQFTDIVNAFQGQLNGHKILLFEGIADEYEGVASVFFHTYAPSYIAGYLSANLIDNCRATSISGFDTPFLQEYIEGFEQGVNDAGGTINNRYFLSDDFDGFEMPDSAYSLTKKLLTDYNLIYGLASGSNYGIVNAARDYPEQRYVIGVWSDQSWMGLNVVSGSVINLFSQTIADYTKAFNRGDFNSGSFYLSMEDNSTTFLMNANVMGNNLEIPDDLLIKAIQKEKDYLLNN